MNTGLIGCASSTGSRAAFEPSTAVIGSYCRDVLLAAVEPALLRRLASLEVHDSLPSTNERLLSVSAAQSDSELAVCLANHQSAGKGRDGKKWHSPAGTGLLLSVSRKGSHSPDSSLALALGVQVAETLESFVDASVDLKWPNDLLADGRKLGGILVESASRPGAETLIVAGLGVNIQVTNRQRRQVAEEGGMKPTGLEEWPAKRPLERHTLAAAMIAAFAEVLERHPDEGFGPWEQSWHGRDWLSGRNIEARCGNEAYRGQATGVDSDGALLLEQPGGQRRILSAEIHL